MRIDKRNLENIPEWMAKRNDVPEGWVYIGDEKERYILGQPGKYNLLVFGVNPSTATPGDNNIDPTIRKVRNIAAETGYDGWIMANLYPLRATNPKDLPQEADKKMLQKNIDVLRAVMSSYTIGAVWAAWGNIIDTRFYLGEALYDIQEALDGDFEWYYRGNLTKNGNPRHPLYMKQGEKMEYFPVADYAMSWRTPEYPDEEQVIAYIEAMETHEYRIYHYLEEHMIYSDFELYDLETKMSEKILGSDEFTELCHELLNLLKSEEWESIASVCDYENVIVNVVKTGAEKMPLGIFDYYALNFFDNWQEEHGDDDIPELDDAINRIFLNEDCRVAIKKSARRGVYTELAKDVGIEI